jgi:hypothetical protein
MNNFNNYLELENAISYIFGHKYNLNQITIFIRMMILLHM